MPTASTWNKMEQLVPSEGSRRAPRARGAGTLGLLVALLPTAAGAGDAAPAPAAAPPAGKQRQLVAAIEASYHPYACCTESLHDCLRKRPPCPLAARLARAIARMAVAGWNKPAIAAALAQRQAVMNPAQPRATILLDERFRAGDAKARVTLALYACPRQKACAKLIPDLHREVTAGRLKGKAALYYRPFFSPGNAEAEACGRGLYAAAYQGKLWPYLLHLCLERESLKRPTLRDWAGQHGLDRCIFDHTCEQADTAAWLEAAHKEGLANGVASAPAVFLDGRRVHGALDLETLVDLAEEAHEDLGQAPAGAGPQDKEP